MKHHRMSPACCPLPPPASSCKTIAPRPKQTRDSRDNNDERSSTVPFCSVGGRGDWYKASRLRFRRLLAMVADARRGLAWNAGQGAACACGIRRTHSSPYNEFQSGTVPGLRWSRAQRMQHTCAALGGGGGDG